MGVGTITMLAALSALSARTSSHIPTHKARFTQAQTVPCVTGVKSTLAGPIASSVTSSSALASIAASALRVDPDVSHVEDSVASSRKSAIRASGIAALGDNRPEYAPVRVATIRL